MEKESIPWMIGFTILLCFSLCIVGCTSNSSVLPPDNNSLGRPPSPLSGPSTYLKIGDTAILAYHDMKKSIRIVSFDQKNGYLTIESENVGNETITNSGTIWLVDGDGIKHPLGNSEPEPDTFYPGDSRSITWSIFDSQISGLDREGRENVMKGKITFYCSLGDAEASWILKEL
jgi:hypothetical protein